jgi:hypothetical protein
MKLSELIAVLNDRIATHGDRDVEFTWEGITRPVKGSEIYLSKGGGLYLNADPDDYGMYKNRFAVDPTEGMTEEEIREMEVEKLEDEGG